MYKLDAVEAEVSELYKQFLSVRTNNADMLSQRNAAIEEKYVAYAASLQFRGSAPVADNEVFTPTSEQQARALLEEGPSGSTVFSCIAGVILRGDQERFARTMFRATRGNAFSEFHNIPEPLRDSITGEEVLKSVFVVYHQGNSTSAMSVKIAKICQSFSAAVYPWPRSEAEAIEQIAQADTMMEDKRAALMAYEKFLMDEGTYLFKLVREQGNSLVEEWKLFCAKEKSIYATLNMFEGDVTLRADCWFPADQEDEVKDLLMVTGRRDSSSGIATKGQVSAMLLTTDYAGRSTTPPTYIKENAILGSFQLIVDTYGVPRYKEANPALFSIVTFPFLFGVMFGDVGHGFMLMMVGVWAIMQSGQLENARGGLHTLYTHRYMVTAMGFFAIYAGLLYSEFFAIGINLFGSKWSCPDNGSGLSKTVECTPMYDITNGGEGPYPFGIDPAWDVASNQLLFVNSLKMKISVLFGVTQMLLGIYLKFANSIYFKNPTDLIFECIPQLAFMLSFFAYMDYMIMHKWVYTGSAPGLIDTMITMGLSGGGVREGSELFSGQDALQTVLFKIGLWSVPLMLVPKPVILWLQHRWSVSRGYNRSGSSDDRSNLIDRSGTEGNIVNSSSSSAHASGHGKVDEHEEFEIGEIAIHQAIETIEFVLGTVSHTASYLRLWALSLAHQQLSLVFLQKTIYAAMSSSWPMILNAIPIYIGFGMFLGITVGILLGMDVMECFLHTLRLHWVEFQSKFYKADGLRFRPFSHRAVCEEHLAGTATGGGSE